MNPRLKLYLLNTPYAWNFATRLAFTRIRIESTSKLEYLIDR